MFAYFFLLLLWATYPVQLIISTLIVPVLIIATILVTQADKVSIFSPTVGFIEPYIPDTG